MKGRAATMWSVVCVCRKLKSVRLAYNQLKVVPSRSLQGLSSSLLQLDLSGNPFTVSILLLFFCCVIAHRHSSVGRTMHYCTLHLSSPWALTPSVVWAISALSHWNRCFGSPESMHTPLEIWCALRKLSSATCLGLKNLTVRWADIVAWSDKQLSFLILFCVYHFSCLVSIFSQTLLYNRYCLLIQLFHVLSSIVYSFGIFLSCVTI